VIYRKLQEIQNKKFTEEQLQTTFEKIYQFSNLADTEQTIKEIENLEPILMPVEDLEEFKVMRTLTHSFEYVASPGRSLKYYVVDKPTQKYLGVITMASDVSRLPPRDNFLGWSKDNMFKDKKLNSSAIAQTIVPIQPFGYNMLGGKLIALMVGDEKIRTDWKSRYGDTLSGITTTSLYGSYSMYNSLPIWKKVGKTKGTIIIKPDNEYYFDWTNWLKKYHTKQFNLATKSVEGKNPPTAIKQKIIKMIFSKLKIQSGKYQNEQSKGVYYIPIHENTKEFLRNEIKEDKLVVSHKLHKEKYIDWWKQKAIKRYLQLHKNNQLKQTPLWYEDLDKKKVQGWLYSRGIRYI
tara:strand:- start:312 stop:1358 length:1047 start_codon:yes stop_codon:yes gene_type:complete